MTKKIQLRIASDGQVEGVADDATIKVVQKMTYGHPEVKRLTHVEWELIENFANASVKAGWTVRSDKNRELAIRYKDDGEMDVMLTGEIVVFDEREEAVRVEMHLANKFLDATRENNG